ncbi:serine hydrolase-like protein 2 [Onthophagus taurus]|uniref:serine hydrolase-like protein 2 n=1 Tax=Onthophagus taurus TaxID=166361 RepID=UPI000C203EA0|nr:serine hydrolase-like protein 2 [Onthophagus taurus]
MLVIKEIEIPVPWGHIAAKAWGDPSDYVIIVIHGLLDNAGSFDTLIPLLPECFYYVCIDLPGHGRSSHFPSSLPLHFLNFQVGMKLVLDYFKRKNYIILAHSLGVRISLITAQLYPELIAKMICLDSAYTPPKEPHLFADDLIEGFNTLMKVLSYKEDETPTLSYEQAVDRIATSRILGRLNYECGEQLGARMMKQVGEDQYIFTFDRKLRSIVYPSFSQKYMQQFLKKRPIRCDGIVIYMNETLGVVSVKRMSPYFNLIPFRRYMVKGHHHSHHTDPECVSTIITTVLLKWKSKL